MKSNILFITLLKVESIYQKGIYTDLIRKFNNESYNIFVVCPTERRNKQKTFLKVEDNTSILNVKTFNMQKVNIFEKAISTISIEYFFSKAINKYFGDIKFDMILYSTPPITLTNLIFKLKTKHAAKTYLLLKDIFPQNAVDMEMFSKKSFIYNYFRKKEISLYKISDTIGCMSPKNAEYILKHNNYLLRSKVEVNPNSIDLVESENGKNKNKIQNKINIPTNAVSILYGGNLGKPQGIDFLIKILESNISNQNCYFIIVGDGTEFKKLKKWWVSQKKPNVFLAKSLPKDEYDELVLNVDIGLVLLDNRFTIPNFPSRILSYMEAKVPVLLSTDVNTDIGSIAVKNNFGLWCESGNLNLFNENLSELTQSKQYRTTLGLNGYEYLKKNYLVENSFKKIESKIYV